MTPDFDLGEDLEFTAGDFEGFMINGPSGFRLLGTDAFKIAMEANAILRSKLARYPQVYRNSKKQTLTNGIAWREKRTMQDDEVATTILVHPLSQDDEGRGRK